MDEFLGMHEVTLCRYGCFHRDSQPYITHRRADSIAHYIQICQNATERGFVPSPKRKRFRSRCWRISSSFPQNIDPYSAIHFLQLEGSPSRHGLGLRRPETPPRNFLGKKGRPARARPAFYFQARATREGRGLFAIFLCLFPCLPLLPGTVVCPG